MTYEVKKKKKKMPVHLTCLAKRMHMPARQKSKLNKWSDAKTQRALYSKPWHLTCTYPEGYGNLPKEVIQSNKHIKKITITARVR